MDIYETSREEWDSDIDTFLERSANARMTAQGYCPQCGVDHAARREQTRLKIAASVERRAEWNVE